MIPRRSWSITKIISAGFSMMAALSVAAMVLLFAWQSIPVWAHAGTGFLTGTKWFQRQQLFGAAPMMAVPSGRRARNTSPALSDPSIAAFARAQKMMSTEFVA